MLENPLATIIIPTYNYANLIGEGIDSILKSNFNIEKIEIIVIDDGSTDDTSEKIKPYRDRITYVKQENAGKAKATKVGIDGAKGKYLFNLDADDLFLPDKIKKVVDIFESDRDIVHVSHPAICWNVNEDTKVIEKIPKAIQGTKVLGKQLLYEFYQNRILFGGGSTFATRTEVAKSWDIPQAVDMYIDEYLVLLSLREKYSYFIPEPLSVWRIHGKNFSDASADREKFKQKMQRNISSMEAVLQSLIAQQFDGEIVKLYGLKNKVSITAIKEQLGEKRFSDITDIWAYVLGNFSIGSKEFFRVLKSYTVLNRTLPTPLLNVLKQAKKTMAQ